jgi:hypothetical protein
VQPASPAEEAPAPPAEEEPAPPAGQAVQAPRDNEARPVYSFRADEGGPTFTFGSSVSFVYDINEPGDRETITIDDDEVGFADENRKLYADGESEEAFNIDLVQLGISGTRSRVSYGAKIDFGDWAEAVEDNLDDQVALQEMYIAIDARFAVISAGRMPTPIGYEVVEPWANPNISRSRAWFFQPISHDGAAIAGVAGPVTLMAAVVNGMQVSDDEVNNPDDEYGVIGSIGAHMPFGDLKLSAIYSDEEDSMRLFELNGFLAGSRERWRYGLEGTWLDGDGHSQHDDTLPPLDTTVWDLTGYGGATFGSWSGDLRLSYTDQEGTNGNLFTQNHEQIVSFTATGGYEIVDGVVIRAEYRVDHSDDPMFRDDDTRMTVAGPERLDESVHVLNVQLMWTPATGRKSSRQ